MTNEEYYLELKRLDAEQAIEDPIESAAGLAGKTKTIEVDVPNARIRDILASNMEYSQVQLLSEERDYLNTPVTTVELAIWAINFMNSGGQTVVNSRDATAWETVVANFEALPPVSDTSMDKIRNLRTDTVPVLSRDPQPEDVIAAREQF
jgi:hypothetical protein